MELTPIEYLSYYLPYNVKVRYKVWSFPGDWIKKDTQDFTMYLWSCFLSKPDKYQDYRLLLYPLSKCEMLMGPFMSSLGLSVLVQYELCLLAHNQRNVETITIDTYRTALQKHIDIFRLIDQGKAEPILS